MKFGKLPDIATVDWHLPAIDPLATRFLQRDLRPPALQFYFGAPAWAHAEWLGKVYPVGTKRTEYLHFYSRHFDCIELNTSHYRIPSVEQTRLWIAQVPDRFLFCPKIHQDISHRRNGLLDRALLEVWFTFLRELGPHLGPCFLQLPPHFDYESKAELFAFLKGWPDSFSLSLEFRHPSWFEDGRIRPALVDYLQSRGIALVMTDVAGRRDVLHGSISADFSLLRFVGNNLDESDFARAKAWTARFDDWKSLGLRKLYLFIHEPDDILVPEMTDHFVDLISPIAGRNLRRTPLPGPQSFPGF